MKTIDEKIKKICSLPIRKFEKRFNEMYDSANDVEKDEIIRSFKKSTNEHIKKVDAFIEETTKMLELDNVLEPQLV